MKKKIILIFFITAIPKFLNPVCFNEVAGSPVSTAPATSPNSVQYSQELSTGTLVAATANGSNSTSVFTVNKTTGLLTQVAGSPFATGTLSRWISFTKNSTGNVFAVVANPTSNNASAFSVNATTGVFSPVAGSPFSVPNGPVNLDISSNIGGNVLVAFVCPPGGVTRIYSINTTTGVLTHLSDILITAPTFASFSPNLGGNLFVAIAAQPVGTDVVRVFSINPVTGSPTQIAGSPFAVGTLPTGVVYSPVIGGNLFAAVNNSGSNDISVFSVNTTTGAFTPVAGSPFPASASPGPGQFFLDSQNNLYAAFPSTTANLVNVYSVNTSTGVFTQVTGSPFTTSANQINLAFTPFLSTNFAFASISNTTPSNAVSTYQFIIPTPVLATAVATCPGVDVTGSGAVANATITVFSDGVSIGTGTADGSGNFNFSVIAVLTDGTHAITVTQTSPQGCLSSQSNSININSNQAETPTLLTAVATCTGVDVTGSGAEANATIDVQADGVSNLGSGTADGSGNFNFSVTAFLTDGSHSITVTQTNSFPCTSSPSNAIIVNSNQAQTPTLTTATAKCTGVSVSGSGADANATITVFSDAVMIGTGSADGSGNFNFSVIVELTNGSHSITVTQTNSFPCTSSSSNAININFAVPVVPTLNTANATCDSINVTGSGTIPNAQIDVFLDYDNLGFGNTDANGNFDITITTPILPGSHLVTVTETVGSCASDSSNTITIEVVCNILRITSPADNTVTTDRLPTFLGIAPEGAEITLLANTQTNSTNLIFKKNNNKNINMALRQLVLGTTTADAFGNWSLTPDTPLAPGVYVVFARLTEDPTVQSNRITLIIEPAGSFDVLSEHIFNKYGCRL